MARPTRGRGRVRGAGPVHGGPRHAPPPGPAIMAAARSPRGPVLVPIGEAGKGLFLLAPPLLSRPSSRSPPRPQAPTLWSGKGAGPAERGHCPAEDCLGRRLCAASWAAGEAGGWGTQAGPVSCGCGAVLAPGRDGAFALRGFLCFLGNLHWEWAVGVTSGRRGQAAGKIRRRLFPF